MKTRHASWIAPAALVAIAVCSLTPVFAQPQPAPADPHKGRHDDKADWNEKYKTELREHPRLGHALVDLHIAKEHLEKAPHDFGGHRADAVKACDEAIKQIELAVKFDAKHEEKPAAGSGDTTPPPKK